MGSAPTAVQACGREAKRLTPRHPPHCSTGPIPAGLLAPSLKSFPARACTVHSSPLWFHFVLSPLSLVLTAPLHQNKHIPKCSSRISPRPAHLRSAYRSSLTNFPHPPTMQILPCLHSTTSPLCPFGHSNSTPWSFVCFLVWFVSCLPTRTDALELWPVLSTVTSIQNRASHGDYLNEERDEVSVPLLNTLDLETLQGEHLLVWDVHNPFYTQKNIINTACGTHSYLLFVKFHALEDEIPKC